MKKKKILTIFIVLALVFIWGNSLVPRELSGEISDAILERLNRAASSAGLGEKTFTVMRDDDHDGTPEETGYLVRKTAHVAEYAVLAALLWLRLEKKSWARAGLAVALGALAGAVDETLQIFSHRGSQLSDVGFDACGAALGVAVCVLAACLAARRRRKKDPAAV